MSGAPDVVGLREAEDILGVRSARVRAELARLEVTELRNGPAWWRDEVLRIRDDRQAESWRGAPDVVGTHEAAELLGTQKSNVRKWADRRSLEARVLAMGRVWLRSDIEAGSQVLSARWKGARV